MLFNKNLYRTAYGKLYQNQGAMTRGITDETVDGMSLEKIDLIIDLLRTEQYRWKPVRRVQIAKGNGKKRRLGLPTWSDKLVQEVIRLILQAYYEPQFNHRSHGFRPKRGCHTALAEIQRIWTGTRWFIEGDIQSCFDSMDQTILLRILSKQIHDNRFLQLIRRLLKAGYLLEWTFHGSLSGVPQGSIVSPLLSNIYLHEFDQYVTTILIPAYTRGERRRTNPDYRRVCNRLRSFKGKKGHGAQVRALRKAQRLMSSKDPYDPDYRRLWYVRYADDMLLGYIGTKQEANAIKEQIKYWLRENLRLTLSQDKTLITHAIGKPARFLGYEIINQQCHTKCTAGKRSINGRIALRVPAAVIAKKCQPYLRLGKPIHRPERLGNSDYSIISSYQQEYRGIVQYYLLATNVCHLDTLHWVMKVSLLKTLAAKHRISVKAAAARYQATTVTSDGTTRKCLSVEVEREGKQPLVARFGGIPLKRQPMARLDDHPYVSKGKPTELEKRVCAQECEVCGSTRQIEVHHIRKLADLNGKDGKQVPAWKKHMIGRQRKTLILCRECHMKVHGGRFDDNLGMRR
jgi:group II intron reverse transcriptase/maturase